MKRNRWSMQGSIYWKIPPSPEQSMLFREKKITRQREKRGTCKRKRKKGERK
jgi:hypothetical protein